MNENIAQTNPRHGLLLALGLLSLLVASCGQSRVTSQSANRLTLTGSSTVAPLATEIARRYEDQHPGVRIDVQTGGSARGIADARSGVADIGMVSRDLKTSESDLLAFTIAGDGIALIVNRANPVTELSDEQVVAIYRGQIRNWSHVGGEDRTITVVNKAEGRSTLELFLSHFGLENSEIRADVVIGDNEQGVKTVAGLPGALGYVSIGTAETDAARGVSIRLLPMGGVEASVSSLQQGRFPLSRRLNLVSSLPPEGLAKSFIDFARSAEVADLVAGLAFVPIRP